MERKIRIAKNILGEKSVVDVAVVERAIGDDEVIDVVDVYYRAGTEISPQAMERVVNALWLDNIEQDRDAFPVVNFVVVDERFKACAAE